MWQFSFMDELQKHADLISKELFNKLDNYTKERIIDARDAISLATNKDTKLPASLRRSIIESAFTSLKDLSYSLLPANPIGGGPVEVSTASKPAKKYVL